MNDVSNASEEHAQDSSQNEEANHFKPLRVWPPKLLISIAAILWLIPRLYEDASVGMQIIGIVGLPLCGILILIWWILYSRATVKERLVGFLGVALAFAVAVLLIDKSMILPGVLLTTIPLGMAAFTVGVLLYSEILSFKRTIVAVLLAACGFAASDLLRSEGMWGEGAALDLHWRWQPTREEQMLAKSEKHEPVGLAELSTEQVDLWLASPEWSGFRGADRLSRQHGPPLATDWSTNAPEQIWKIPIGPGWSSFAVAGNLLFTQEQRGDAELVVCYTADTGREVWAHEVETRFYESMGGAGPRATPTLAEGNLFAMGANGHLMRLDPRNGEEVWQVDLQEVANRKPPEWGFSSSPLVIGSNVIVHTGGEGDKGTLALDVETGELNWSAPAGDHSYSSPQLGTIAGEPAVLVLTNAGLDVLDPQTGAQRLVFPWEYENYRVLQPHVVDDDSVLLATGMAVGTRRIQISSSEGKLTAKETWTSRHLKPDFNDFVIHDNHAYGFDGRIFVCIDLQSGKRTWKGGRYGKGQVLLLEDSKQLLVASESGEVVLFKADPSKRQELAKFQALEGKTWNHPVVVGDRLYIRNAQEAACYRMPLADEANLTSVSR